MKRYRHLNSPCCRTYGWLAEKPDGEWMRFEDHSGALAAKDAELQTALRTIEALVAAGFVTQAKVDQARSLFTEDQPAPHPDSARLDKLPDCFHMLRTDAYGYKWWLTRHPDKVYLTVREAIDAHVETGAKP